MDFFILGRLYPDWKEKNIVVKEFFRILDNLEKESQSRKEFLCYLEDRVYGSYASEKYYDDPIMQQKKSSGYMYFNKLLLDAESLSESMEIVKKAEGEGIKFSQPFINLLSITVFLKEMERKGQLELAMKELYLVTLFNMSYDHLMSIRREKEAENRRVKFFIHKAGKKAGAFTEYLRQVEDEWHPLYKDKKGKKISKNEALVDVFNQHIKNDSFIKKFQEEYAIDITDENGLISAFKIFKRMFNKYTNFYYLMEGATKNGYKKKDRVLSDETKEKIGKAIRQRNELKKKQKRRRRFHPVTVKNGSSTFCENVR